MLVASLQEKPFLTRSGLLSDARAQLCASKTNTLRKLPSTESTRGPAVLPVPPRPTGTSNRQEPTAHAENKQTPTKSTTAAQHSCPTLDPDTVGRMSTKQEPTEDADNKQTPAKSTPGDHQAGTALDPKTAGRARIGKEWEAHVTPDQRVLLHKLTGVRRDIGFDRWVVNMPLLPTDAAQANLMVRDCVPWHLLSGISNTNIATPPIALVVHAIVWRPR